MKTHDAFGFCGEGGKISVHRFNRLVSVNYLNVLIFNYPSKLRDQARVEGELALQANKAVSYTHLTLPTT